MTWEHYAKRAAQTFNEPATDPDTGLPTGPGLEEIVADHGNLQGLSDDDHAHYLKEKASGGLASEVPEHNHTTAAQAGVVSGLGHTIEDEGSALTARSSLNFVGAGVSAADSGGKTVVTIAGGSGTASAAAVYNSIDVAAGNGAEALVTMDTELFDTDGYHSTSADTARFTIPTGKGGKFGWAVNLRTSDNLEAYFVVRKNNTTILGIVMNYVGAEALGVRAPSNMAGIIDLVATDYIELKSLRSAAGAVSIVASGGTIPWFSIWRIGD